MQRSLIPLVCVLLCAAVLGTGCTSSSGVQAAGTPAPVTTAAAHSALSSLALVPSDMPAGSVLVSAKEKTSDDVSSMAKDLGWQAGYVAVFTLPSNSTAPTTVTHSLAYYAGRSMSDIVPLISNNERQEKDLVFSDLTPTATGTDTRTFAAAANTSQKAASVVATNAMGISSESAAPEGYIETVFGKGGVIEVIRISGPGAQYDTLASLAQTAYAKTD